MSAQRRTELDPVQVERQRFNNVLDMLPAYVILLSPDYRVPFANRFFEERFGKSHGKRCYEYLFQRTEPCENCETYKVFQTGTPHRWEWTGPDGRNYDIHDFPFTDVDGSPLVMEVGLDITDRKKAEAAIKEANEGLEQRVAERTAALAESEERLRLLSDNLPDSAVYQYAQEADGSVRFLHFSAGIERLCGVRVQEVLCDANVLMRQILPEHLGRLQEEGAHSARELSDFDMELPIRRSDGEVRWMRLHSRPRSVPDGRIIWDGVIIDITARKHAEERAKLLSEVRAQLLTSDQPQQIIEALCHRVMEHLQCHVFFNFLEDESSGRLHLNACAGIPEEDAHAIEWLDYGVAICGCVARDGCRIVAEHVQTTADPRADLVRGFGVQAYACHPLLNDGRPIGTLSFGSRTKATFDDDELSLMKAVADHVAIAMQRIRLLESLNRHARAAQAASEAKSQFLANMSHELRTPMNAILGMIDMALSKAIHPTVQDCLRTAKGSADLLLTLLNDLLDSAKIESGKLELESSPFSLRRLLDQTTQILAVRASEKGLAFYCRVPDETPDMVLGDSMRLQQILLNLAGNAIKFTKHGDVEIRLRDLSRDGEVCLEFAVRDTGIGIPPENMERLFQPFSQADASMSRRFGGTGLGLSICKSLVEMMGGRIWAKSEPGKGSTFFFTVRMPLVTELPADFEAPTAILPAPSAQLHILLAEDNPANQKLATYILQDRGHWIDIAVNGQEAIYLAERNHYDVILMDVQMPEINGLEATAAIRKQEKAGCRVPIIAMTAHAMKDSRERCLAADMDGYLSKPIDANETIALVERLAAKMIALHHADSQHSAKTEATPPRPTIVFEYEDALKQCLNKRDLLHEMMGFFFKDADTVLPQIRIALKNGDLVEVGRLGHRLKGTITHLAAESARLAALRVERFLCDGGDQAEAEEAVYALERECDALKAALADCPFTTERVRSGS